jgi:YYY domain-containing protein
LRSVWAPRILLVIILLLGAYFRTLSLTNWDSDTGQHPDERFFSDVASTVRLPGSLSELYDSSRSPLNPRNYDRFPLYVYGPFPVIAARIAAVTLTPAEALPAQAPRINGPPRVGADPANPGERRTDYGPLVANPERAFPRAGPLIPLLNPEGRDLTAYGQIQKVGRGLAVLFDLGSIVLVYLIGRRLFDRRVGLLAALLAALTVMQIQQAHFFVDPIFSTFFCLLSLYWALRAAQGGGWLSYAALGLAIGAAMANRITLATLGLAAIAAAVVAAWRRAQGGSRVEGAPVAVLAWERFLWRELPLLFLAGALTLLSFRTLAPDAFTGSTPTSPVQVIEGRPQTAGWLQGAGFLDIRPEPRFVSNIGSVRALVSGELDYPPSQQWVRRTPYLFPWVNMVLWGMGPALGLAAWGGAAAFALRGLRRALWPRAASLSLSPAWVLLAWIGFYFGWQGGQFAITLRYLLPIYGALTVFGAWGLVRLADLAREPAPPAWRVLAIRGGRWALPLVVLATLAWAYAFSRIYTQPHSRVMAARWLADNAPPGAFVMSEIWDDPLPLQAADAAWGATFQGLQSAPYAEDEPRKYLGGVGPSGGYEEGLLDQLDRADYVTLTSNRIYDSTSRLRMRYPALMRYYHALFSGELGFRLAAEITSYPRILGIEIPDQGAEEAFHVYDHPRVLIFEKTAAYSRERAEALITGDVLWEEVYKSPVLIADRNPAALRLTDGQWRRYAAGGDWAGYALPLALAPLTWLLALEALSLATFALLFPLLPRLPDRGFSLAKILGLLLVAYLAWLAGSLGNDPGIPGRGNAGVVGRGPFPLPFAPATLWLCAAPLVLAGAVAAWRARAELRAFGQARRAALLSAEAVFLGFFFLGILLRLLNPDLWHPTRGGEKPMDFAYFNAVLRSAAFPPYDPWHAGGFINYYYLGFVLVGALTHLSGTAPAVAYNLAVATVLGLTALGAWGVLYNLLGGRADAVEERRALAAAGLAPALALLLGNLAQAVWFLSGYAAAQAAKGRPEWAYWDATRIVPGTVNEFPFFTFLFGDLHAHMLVMPLSLALLGLAVAYGRDVPRQTGRAVVGRAMAYALAMGLLAGAIRATNTWDYPPFVGLAALLLAVAGWRASRGRGLARGLLWIAGPPLLMAISGNFFFAPFVANFATESSGVELWREGLAPTLLGQALGAPRTTLREGFLLYGHWLFAAATAGALLLRRLAGPKVALGAAEIAAGIAVIGLALNWPALVLLIPLLGAAFGLLWRLRRAPPGLLIPGLWLAGGLGLLALVEVVTVRGDIGRMNTVFKFGLHAWMLFALGTAALLPRLWAAPGAAPRLITRGGLALLAVVALVYPVTATPARAADRWAPDAPRTLDGTAFMAAVSAERYGEAFSLDEDAAAIAWLRRNVSGTPVILEAHLPSYQWAGRVAAHTGLPTLLGWEWHQVQQRNAVGAGPVIAARQRAVQRIYADPDPDAALALLRSYGVEYIYVGGVERASYDPAGLAKFEQLAARGDLERVFAQGNTTIYRVAGPAIPRMLTSDLDVTPPIGDTPPPLMLRTPVNELPAVAPAAWNRPAAENSWLAALAWLAALYALALPGLPVAHAVFGGWRDAGWTWAKLIGWLLAGYAVWLPASLGLWRHNGAGLPLGLALVLLLNLALLWWMGRGAEGSALARVGRGLGDLGRALWARRAAVLWSEGMFLTGFTGLALIRALNPDLWHPIWGGEKPMELGFLNAVLRSPVLPPYDPFFSGGYINYYYYGYFLVALPVRMAGLPAAMGFNLALATIAGLTLAAAFALVSQLTGRARYGALAAALVGVAGNLAGFFAVGWSRGFPAVAEALRQGGLAGFGARLGDWFVGPSRVIRYTINEFPAFAFLYADLHPHTIALPITLLALALGYRLVEGKASSAGTEVGALPQGYVSLLLLGLTLGTLAVTNSWDVPTYALVASLALLGAAWRASGLRAAGVPWHRLVQAGLVALAVVVGGLVLFAPFFDHYWAPVGGIGLVPLTDGTTPRDYLVIYGLFIAVLLPALLGAARRVFAPSRSARVRSPVALGATGALAPGAGAWWPVGVIAGLLLLGAMLPTVGLRLALVALLMLGATVLSRRAISAPVWYGLLLLWVALAISLGIELVYIRDHLDGGDWYRMNTVFKFGLQVWVLLAIAAAVSLPLLLRGVRRAWGRAGAVGALAALGVLAALAAIYPLAGTPSRLDTRMPVRTGPTLDGLAFLNQARFTYDCLAYGGCEPGVTQVEVDLSGDGPAIAWLNREIAGTPVVVQSSLFFYRAYGIRVAANTGLPTVISALHVNEQRDPAVAARRERELDTFFRAPDVETALRFLARYRVDYIYIGGVERAFYPAAGLAKFEQMRGTYLETVYDARQTRIYRVTGVPPGYAWRPLAERGAPARPAGPPPADLAQLEAALAANPTDGPLAFALAEHYRDQGRLDEAAQVLERAARANPRDIGVMHLWGDILAEAGRYDEAEEAYLMAARAEPSAANWHKIGSALLAWGRLDKAEIALSQAVVADPSAPDPYFSLGKLFALQGDRERARAELEIYLALAPDGPWAEEARRLLGDL